MTEHEQLIKRQYKDYSLGHQRMYLAPIELMKNTKSSVLEIGFGIGWGLDRMVANNIISEYVGCEPDKDSFDYVTKVVKDNNQYKDKIELFNCEFKQLVIDKMFDYTFCVEVVEHMDEEDFWFLLNKVHKYTKKTFFLSTPDLRDNKHGVYYTETMVEILKEHKFNVSFVRQQWTTLFVANPI